MLQVVGIHFHGKQEYVCSRVNILAAAQQATQGARSSGAMVWTKFDKNIQLSAPES